MKNIAKEIGEFTDSYSVCVPSADSWLRDTLSGFLMNMDANVEAFAAAVQADENLASGFNAVGFSQGNSIIRGYIQKYNDPPVLSFLSVHGTVSGVTSLPNCDPAGSRGSLCQVGAEARGRLQRARARLVVVWGAQLSPGRGGLPVSLRASRRALRCSLRSQPPRSTRVSPHQIPFHVGRAP